METVQYRIKQIYGKDTMYPANDFARMICELTGRKTLTETDLRVLASREIKTEQVM